MMTKIIGVGSWDSPAFDNPVQLVPVSSRGLIGSDRTAFLKIAAHEFADLLDRCELLPGDIPLHIRAIGAQEAFGSNRNGDGFTEKTARETHHRFVTSARHYRHHDNQYPDKSYGYVKHSMYSEPMRRVELLVIANGTKEAAARNGGLVLPDSSLDRIHSGDLLGYSMACKVANDVCSNCGNKAPSRRHYCTEDTCVHPETGYRGFGCARGLGKVADDGFQQFVDNPDPYFFDISEVGRPADPTAWGGLASYKAALANTDHVLGGAEIAEVMLSDQPMGLWFPEQTAHNTQLVKAAGLLEKLARFEREYFNGKQTSLDRALAYTQMVKSVPLPSTSPPVKMAVAVLSSRGIMIPPRLFADLLFRTHNNKQAATEQFLASLPGVFLELQHDPQLPELLRGDDFKSAGRVDRFTDKFASQLNWYNCDMSRATLEALRGVMSGMQPRWRMKQAGAVDPAAKTYALYQLHTLRQLPYPVPDGVARMAIGWNWTV